MRDSELAIFPLNTVLFPGGPLALRIFEPRYVDMVSRCMRDNADFGVVAIESGNETGNSSTYQMGTRARIGDWYEEPEGLLGIVVIGADRFRIDQARVQADGLHMAEVSQVENEQHQAVPEQYRYMAELMESIIDQLGEPYALIDRKFNDASWLGYRLAEVLPVRLDQRQAMLESNDALQRLASLAPVLDALSTVETNDN